MNRQEQLQSFLEVFHGVSEWVYAINREDYTLLYANDKARKVLPENSIGSFCHEALMGSKEPCPDCPLRPENQGCPIHTKLYCRFLDDLVQVSAANIQEDVFLVVFHQPAQSKEELEYQRQKDRLDVVLQENCDYIMTVDTSSREYLCRLVEDGGVAFRTGDYQEFLDSYIEKHIQPAKEETYRESFSFDTLLQNTRMAPSVYAVYFTTYDRTRGIRYHSTTSTLEKDDRGREILLLCTKDITDLHEAEKKVSNRILERQRLRAQKEMRLTNERYRVILEQTGIMDWEYDLITKRSHISPLLYEKFTVLNRPFDLTKSIYENLEIYEPDFALFQEFQKNFHDGAPSHEVTCRFYDASHKPFWCRVSVNKIRDQSGKLVRFYGTLQDVDEQVTAMEALRYRADYDSLTHLPHADFFYRSVQAVLERNPNQKFAVVTFDIDKFRVVNDLYGKQYGDEALCHIAQVLQNALVDISWCCRLYADHFGLLLSYEQEEDILSFLDSVQEKVSHITHGVDLTLSFGVYCVVDRSVSVNMMCDWANLAKRHAKDNRLQPVTFYDDAMRNLVLRDRRIESQMHTALQQGQFQMYLQPKVDIATSQIVGAEALVRWEHPEKGVITPDTFIPLFEKNGFIFQLDLYMMRQACRTLRSWIDSGRMPVPISVNLSRAHAFYPNVVYTLSRVIEEYQIPRSFLQLEVTENMFFQNIHEIYHMLLELKNAGFSIAMDDFGSGYSSLNMLKDMPVDVIKLDRAFFNKAMSTEREQMVIRSVISMVNQLHMGIVAEGVETQEQARFLLEADCPTAQGYYYYRPMPLEGFEKACFDSAPLSLS